MPSRRRLRDPHPRPGPSLDLGARASQRADRERLQTLWNGGQPPSVPNRAHRVDLDLSGWPALSSRTLAVQMGQLQQAARRAAVAFGRTLAEAMAFVDRAMAPEHEDTIQYQGGAWVSDGTHQDTPYAGEPPRPRTWRCVLSGGARSGSDLVVSDTVLSRGLVRVAVVREPMILRDDNPAEVLEPVTSVQEYEPVWVTRSNRWGALPDGWLTDREGRVVLVCTQDRVLRNLSLPDVSGVDFGRSQLDMTNCTIGPPTHGGFTVMVGNAIQQNDDGSWPQRPSLGSTPRRWVTGAFAAGLVSQGAIRAQLVTGEPQAPRPMLTPADDRDLPPARPFPTDWGTVPDTQPYWEDSYYGHCQEFRGPAEEAVMREDPWQRPFSWLLADPPPELGLLDRIDAALESHRADGEV